MGLNRPLVEIRIHMEGERKLQEGQDHPREQEDLFREDPPKGEEDLLREGRPERGEALCGGGRLVLQEEMFRLERM